MIFPLLTLLVAEASATFSFTASLRSHLGTYVTLTEHGGLNGEATEIGPNERFTFMNIFDDYWVILVGKNPERYIEASFIGRATSSPLTNSEQLLNGGDSIFTMNVFNVCTERICGNHKRLVNINENLMREIKRPKNLEGAIVIINVIERMNGICDRLIVHSGYTRLKHGLCNFLGADGQRETRFTLVNVDDGEDFDEEE